MVNVGYGEPKSRFIDRGRTEEMDDYQTLQYSYHPFSPLVLIDSQNPKFILKEKDDSSSIFTKLPAFLLYANDQTAFWKNVFTGVEYTVDIISTIAGFRSLIEVGRLVYLARLLNSTKNIKNVGVFASKLNLLHGVKKTAGLIEVTAGSVNIMLKLTGKNDTELGKMVA